MLILATQELYALIQCGRLPVFGLVLALQGGDALVEQGHLLHPAVNYELL